MKREFKKSLIQIGLLACMPLTCVAHATEISPNIRDVVVFQGGEGGSNYYRIPSMVVAKDGSLVAFAEGRVSGADPGTGSPNSIKTRRSTDNGVTWSDYQVIQEGDDEAYSDPRPLLDQTTGRIFIFYTKWDNNCAQNGSCVPFDDPNHKLMYRTSDDNGQTWSEPVDILDQVKDVNWLANGMEASNGRATWSVTPSHGQFNALRAQGWTLGWEARVAEGSCNVQYFGDGEKRFLADLQVNPDKTVKAVLYSDDGNIEQPLDFDISGYHQYQIVGSGETASFYVDGTLIANNWTGQSNSEKTITWGNGCSSTPGAIAYKSVDFAIGHHSKYHFDASLMQRVDGEVIEHPAEQGWIRTSANNGKGDPGWKSLNAGPGHGIQLSNGRLIFPAIALDAFDQLAVVSVYSDDHGVTWHAGNQTPTYLVEPSESDLVELNDGRLLLSSRNDGVTGEGNFNRYHFISSDHGVNWNMVEEQRDSINGALFFKLDPVDIGLIRYGDDRVLMSGPQGTGAISSDRNDLAVWSAVDDGAGNYNFTQRTQFRDGYTAYSDIVTLKNKGEEGNEDVGVLYEATSNTEIRLMVMDIDDIK